MDPWTTALLMLITCTECSLLFFASGMLRRKYSSGAFPPSLFWGLGTAIYVVGLLALLTQSLSSPWIGVIFSNTLLIMGFMLIIVGVRRLSGLPLALPRYLVSLSVYVLLAFLLTFVFRSTTARIILFSCLIAALYLEGAIILFREGKKRPNPFSPIVATVFSLLALFFIARGIISTAYPQSSVFTRTLLNAGTFVVSHVGLIAWSLGLILLQNLQMASDLKRAYGEKEVLLRELQHRVKNSMAVISGLVSLESSRVESEEFTNVLENLKGRIDAISSLYDRLYRAGETEEVELDAYLHDLVEPLREGSAAASKGIAMETTLENVRLDAKRAISLGLIANELLTDCLKYAFPGGRTGTIRLALKREADELVLEVADDGAGLPEGFSVGASSGLGLALVDMLAAQLGGTFRAESNGGARFVVRFSLS